MKKLSAHCNITNPEKAGYPYLESIESFANLCDEVIVVDGGSIDGSLEKIAKIPKVKIIQGEKWDYEFDWTIMPKNLQKGYEECSGDWAFHFDVDYIFHEDDVLRLKELTEKTDLPGIELCKINFVLANENYKKNYYPLFIYKKRYPKVGYGIGFYKNKSKSSSFLCPISIIDKWKNGVLYGDYLNNQIVKYERYEIPIYCYDFTFMTKEQVIENRYRFMNAVEKYGGSPTFYSKERVFEKFISMMKLRHEKNCSPKDKNKTLEYHSKFIRERIKNITPDMFGHSGFGLI